MREELQFAEEVPYTPPPGRRPVRLLGDPPLSDADQQLNRQRMIDRVRAFWLEHTEPHFLHERLRQQTERPEVMDDLLQLMLHLADQRSGRALPASQIAAAFEQASGRLLLLGERGVGKTTLLLRLMQELLLWATQDESFPIPALFSLASWTPRHPDLSAWLIAELQRLYQVPEKIARNWVNTHAILPLLDGLDELDIEKRRSVYSGDPSVWRKSPA